MTNLQKFGLVLLVIITAVFIKIAYFPQYNLVPDFLQKSHNNSVDSGKTESSDEKSTEQAEKMPKMFVSVYFIGQNKNNDEVYKIVKREYDADSKISKLEFAITSLLKGPSISERKKHIYTEIPKGTKLLSLRENPDRVIIDLSSEFEQGGGTDGLYKRLYQLIKTSNRNTNKDVYLKINGVQAEVIGGEGIMINQPLNNNSIGE